MKKLFFLLPVLFVAFLSCNDKKDPAGPGDDPREEEKVSKSVIGKWKIVEMDMKDMEEEDRQDALRNSGIEFKKNGSYSSDDGDEGTYEYDKEAGTMTVTSDEDQNEIEFKISWQGSKMVMKSNLGTVVLSRSGGSSTSRDDDEEEDMDDSRVTSIAGKWRIADVESADGEKPNAEEMKNMRASTIEFDRDGSYTAITRRAGGKSDRETGTYKFDAKAKTLETTSDTGDENQSFEIVFRGKDKMICTSSDGKITLEKD